MSSNEKCTQKKSNISLKKSSCELRKKSNVNQKTSKNKFRLSSTKVKSGQTPAKKTDVNVETDDGMANVKNSFNESKNAICNKVDSLNETVKEELDTQTKVIYQFKAYRLDGQMVSMRRYYDKVVLIVNFASNDRHFGEKMINNLIFLFNKYNKKGFEVAAFPTNQFGCEPLDSKEMAEFIKEQEIHFDVYRKIELSGPNADPMFSWLKEVKGGFITNTIKYNFTKFLIDRRGYPYKRYSPAINNSDLEDDIKLLLKPATVAS